LAEAARTWSYSLGRLQVLCIIESLAAHSTLA
jgi:hypothetical protein